MLTNHTSVIEATHAVATAPIPAGGRRISYRDYLIHGEVPSICYIIYGRGDYGQLTELGATRSFTDAMRWVDRHIVEMRRLLPVVAEEPLPHAAEPELPAAA